MPLQHLLDISSLSKTDLTHILDRAASLVASNAHSTPTLNTLQGKTAVNLFFEPSTRTRCSFELAAQRLGAQVLNLNMATSATVKKESLLDTILTLDAMHIDFFVVRHSEEHIATWIAKHLKSNAHVINAGDGTHAHPTQALTDMLTIQQHKADFSQLKVAIVGDIVHSRVAASAMQALQLLETKEIRLIGPPEFLPSNSERGISIWHDLDQGLQDIDVVMALRIQTERMQQQMIPSGEAYFAQFGLTSERLKHAKPDAIVMHPGPLNRGVEIDSAVADGSQSVILQQVSNGVAVRMAVLEILGA